MVGIAAEKLLDEVIKAHGTNFGSLQLWDATTRSLYLIAHRFDRPSAEHFATVRDGDGTVCEAAQASDIEEGEAFASLRNWTRAIGIRAIQTTPVFGRSGNFVGAFSTHYASPRSFAGEENEMTSMYKVRFSERR